MKQKSGNTINVFRDKYKEFIEINDNRLKRGLSMPYRKTVANEIVSTVFCVIFEFYPEINTISWTQSLDENNPRRVYINGRDKYLLKDNRLHLMFEDCLSHTSETILRYAFGDNIRVIITKYLNHENLELE